MSLKILNIDNKLIIGKYEETLGINGGRKTMILRDPRNIIFQNDAQGVLINFIKLIGDPDTIEIFNTGLMFMYENKDPDIKIAYAQSISSLTVVDSMPRPVGLNLKKS